MEALEPGDLERFADALLESAPGFAERFADAVLTDLTEEISRREDPRHSHAVVTLIRDIAEDWRNDA